MNSFKPYVNPSGSVNLATGCRSLDRSQLTERHSKRMEEIDITQINNTHYPKDVVCAVRYGYQYRLEAEEYAERDVTIHSCLADASAILLWLGKQVLSGATYDVIKQYAKRLWDKLMSMKIVIPEDVDKVLLNEDELRKFVVYVTEFQGKSLTTTEKQTQYIREEIVADYVGECAGEIWAKEKRAPNHDEWVRINREANKFADELLEE